MWTLWWRERKCQSNSSYGNHECLYPISYQSMYDLLKYFSLDQSSGLINTCTCLEVVCIYSIWVYECSERDRLLFILTFALAVKFESQMNFLPFILSHWHVVFPLFCICKPADVSPPTRSCILRFILTVLFEWMSPDTTLCIPFIPSVLLTHTVTKP